MVLPHRRIKQKITKSRNCESVKMNNMTITPLNDIEMIASPEDLTVTKIMAREAERKRKEVSGVLGIINNRIRKALIDGGVDPDLPPPQSDMFSRVIPLEIFQRDKDVQVMRSRIDQQMTMLDLINAYARVMDERHFMISELHDWLVEVEEKVVRDKEEQVDVETALVECDMMADECRQTLQYTLSLCDKLRNIKAGMLAYVVAVRNARDESIRAGLVKQKGRKKKRDGLAVPSGTSVRKSAESVFTSRSNFQSALIEDTDDAKRSTGGDVEVKVTFEGDDPDNPDKLKSLSARVTAVMNSSVDLVVSKQGKQKLKKAAALFEFISSTIEKKLNEQKIKEQETVLLKKQVEKVMAQLDDMRHELVERRLADVEVKMQDKQKMTDARVWEEQTERAVERQMYEAKLRSLEEKLEDAQKASLKVMVMTKKQGTQTRWVRDGVPDERTQSRMSVEDWDTTRDQPTLANIQRAIERRKKRVLVRTGGEERQDVDTADTSPTELLPRITATTDKGQVRVSFDHTQDIIDEVGAVVLSTQDVPDATVDEQFKTTETRDKQSKKDKKRSKEKSKSRARVKSPDSGNKKGKKAIRPGSRSGKKESAGEDEDEDESDDGDGDNESIVDTVFGAASRNKMRRPSASSTGSKIRRASVTSKSSADNKAIAATHLALISEIMECRKKLKLMEDEQKLLRLQVIKVETVLKTRTELLQKKEKKVDELQAVLDAAGLSYMVKSSHHDAGSSRQDTKSSVDSTPGVGGTQPASRAHDNKLSPFTLASTSNMSVSNSAFTEDNISYDSLKSPTLPDRNKGKRKESQSTHTKSSEVKVLQTEIDQLKLCEEEINKTLKQECASLTRRVNVFKLNVARVLENEKVVVTAHELRSIPNISSHEHMAIEDVIGTIINATQVISTIDTSLCSILHDQHNAKSTTFRKDLEATRAAARNAKLATIRLDAELKSTKDKLAATEAMYSEARAIKDNHYLTLLNNYKVLSAQHHRLQHEMKTMQMNFVGILRKKQQLLRRDLDSEWQAGVVPENRTAVVDDSKQLLHTSLSSTEHSHHLTQSRLSQHNTGLTGRGRSLQLTVVQQKYNLDLLQHAHNTHHIPRDVYYRGINLLRHALQLPLMRLRNLFEKYFFQTQAKAFHTCVQAILRQHGDCTDLDYKDAVKSLRLMDYKLLEMCKTWLTNSNKLHDHQQLVFVQLRLLLKDIIKNTGLLLVPPLEVCHFDTGHNKVTKVTRCHTHIKPPCQLTQPLPAAGTVVAKAFHSHMTTGHGDTWTVTDADRQPLSALPTMPRLVSIDMHRELHAALSHTSHTTNTTTRHLTPAPLSFACGYVIEYSHVNIV